MAASLTGKGKVLDEGKEESGGSNDIARMILRSHRPPDRVVSWSIQILARFLLIFWISGLPWARATPLDFDRRGCPEGCTCLDKSITCRKRNFTEIPVDILPWWTEALYLPRNFIANLSNDNLAKLPANLTILDLSYNGLNISEGINWPPLLQELILHHNKIEKITSKMFLGLPHLKELDLSHNLIDDVKGMAFHKLGQMTKLKLNHNRLHSLRDGILVGVGTNLRELRLDNNYLYEIRKGYLFHTHGLLKANFSNNQIRTIEDGVWGNEGVSRIRHIDLSKNKLTHIKSKTFQSDKGTIERIYINRNTINKIDDGAFRHLPKLKILDVSHNVIGDAFDSPAEAPFSGLMALHTLRLVNVDATIISNRSFVQLPKLQTLNLFQNEIRIIEPSTFDLIGSALLEDIFIQSESFVCDCQMRKLHKDLPKRSYFDSTNLQCAFPEEIRGVSFRELNAAQLKCFPTTKLAIAQDPQPVTAVTGFNTTFSCIISFSPETVTFIRWLKNGNLITQVESSTSAAVDGKSTSTLYLTQVNPRDAGDYACMAHSIFKKVYSHPARLTVEEPPRFKKIPDSHVTVRQGEKARLGECWAIGFPNPEVSWSKDGGTTFLAAADLRVNFQIGMYWLEIARVKFEDAGVYSCHARNSAGEAVANVTLTVQNYTETQTMSKRSHTIKPKETGETVTLECPNQANWTRVLWYQNDSMLEESETARRVVLADGLHIKNLTEQDSGFYVCEEALTGERGPSFTLQVSRKPAGPGGGSGGKKSDWYPWGMDSTTFYVGVAVLATLFLGLSVTLIAVGVLYCGRKRSDSGGSSTRSEETALPDECNPINGLHPSVDSNLNSPMTEYTEYTPVASEYSVGDGRFLIANNGGTFGALGSQARCKSYGESLAESQSFGNYLTLKPAPNIQSSYSPVPQRSYLTMPRVTRI
ncbi:hypothetical protein RvY_06018 [Ramazzottius varieornatus]|uniref:Ig-like domain-containing protein n=1 Tax=Ramazzottius varieornatus TaxID=947166 RepID=A0A1D1UX34_RAMVA|nr:hypothetical protein RvY_06018 [Ramazzottius varieornatus]